MTFCQLYCCESLCIPDLVSLHLFWMAQFLPAVTYLFTQNQRQSIDRHGFATQLNLQLTQKRRARQISPPNRDKPAKKSTAVSNQWWALQSLGPHNSSQPSPGTSELICLCTSALECFYGSHFAERNLFYQTTPTVMGKGWKGKTQKVTQQYRVGDCKLWHSSITFSLAFLVTVCTINAPGQVYSKTTAPKT